MKYTSAAHMLNTAPLGTFLMHFREYYCTLWLCSYSNETEIQNCVLNHLLFWGTLEVLETICKKKKETTRQHNNLGTFPEIRSECYSSLLGQSRVLNSSLQYKLWDKRVRTKAGRTCFVSAPSLLLNISLNLAGPIDLFIFKPVSSISLLAITFSKYKQSFYVNHSNNHRYLRIAKLQILYYSIIKRTRSLGTKLTR